MINQLNVEVSFPVDVRVNPDVLCAVIETCPGVPPVVALLNKITLEAVQAVVETVTAPGVPLMALETPQEALEPVVIESLFPAVPRTKFPFVAVILPRVAVMLVPALTAPAVATILPVVEVIPVPAVTVVPAVTEPAVAAMFPSVAVMLPADTTAFPVVTVSPVPAVIVVVDAKVVVVVSEPGVIIAEGNDTVATPATVLTEIWLVVPCTATTSPDPLVNRDQLPPPA